MESPFSVPALPVNLGEIDEQPRRSRSCDDEDLDFTYSEDVSSAANSPTAALHTSFIPRNIEGAPTLPLTAPPLPVASSPKAVRMLGGGILVSTFGQGEEQAPSSVLEDERRHILVDYDLDEEEDYLLDKSSETAPLPSSPLAEKRPILLHKRSSSLSDVMDDSLKSFESEPSDVFPDISVPSLGPSPMRRVSSTPSHQDTERLLRKSTPPLGNARFRSPQRRASTGSPKQQGLSSPYAFTKQISLPVTAGERKLPSVRTAPGTPRSGPNTPMSRNGGGASIFRAGRSGIVASPSGRPSPMKVTTPLQSPPEQLLEENVLNPPPLSSPYQFRRQVSLPITTRDLNGSNLRFVHATERAARDERSTTRKARDRVSGIFRPGRPPTPSSVGSSAASAQSPSKESVESEKWPEIQHNPTINTDASDEEELVGSEIDEADHKAHHRKQLSVEEGGGCTHSDPSRGSKDDKALFQRQRMLYIVFIAAFSVFGSTIRVFLGRMFGSHCEFSDSPYDDFCVTANGRTMQRGGALFVDLPANMIGCFIMGILTSLKPGVWPPLPWLKGDHPLQQHDAYHVGLRAGLCGCITTWASWNTQLVVMMDGTVTQLGPQIVTALFGYIVGFFCAIASFLVGTHVSVWLTRWKNPEIAHEDDEELLLNSPGSIDHGPHYNQSEIHATLRTSSSPPSRVVVLPPFVAAVKTFCTRLLCRGSAPFIILAFLLAGYGVGGFANDNRFYRTLFFASIFTPPGALLRWELSKCNTRIADLRWRRLNWVPWGTFIANVLGSCISIALLAIEIKYFSDNKEENAWVISLLNAARIGFAGSLSTVSTMVNEMFELTAKFPYHAKAYHYSCLTTVTCIVLCLCIFSPIVRSS